MFQNVPQGRRDTRGLGGYMYMIDRAGPIETGEDLIEWVGAADGKGLGLTQKKS